MRYTVNDNNNMLTLLRIRFQQVFFSKLKASPMDLTPPGIQQAPSEGGHTTKITPAWADPVTVQLRVSHQEKLMFKTARKLERIWMFPKIVGENPPNHPLKNRVFHYFHHPFWGCSPYFWKHPYAVCHQFLVLTLGGLMRLET